MAISDELMANKKIILCVVFGVVCGAQVNLAKELTLGFEPSYIVFIRSVSMIVFIPFIEWDEADTWGVAELALYITASVAAIIPFGTMVVSLEYIGAGDSNAIEFGAGLILTGVFGHLVLKEKISCLYLLLMIVNSLGVLLVAKPHFVFGGADVGGAVGSREIGAVSALIGALFFAIWPVITRSIVARGNLDLYILAIMHGWVGMVLVGVWCTVDSSWVVPGTWSDIALLIAYGFSGDLQMILAVKVVQQTAAVEYAVAMTISVVISYVLQVTVFGEDIDWICVLGAVIVIVCVILSAFWEYLGETWKDRSGSEQPADISPDEKVNLVTNDD